MLVKHKSLELKKHVGAIHSSNTLSLIQRKIANGLLFNAYNDLLTKDEHQISVKDLCSLIGYDSKDYKTIKNALINLLSTVIEWNLIDKETTTGEGIWSASSIIADATIEGSKCYYSYSNRMKQLLHRPEIYGRLNMTIQAKFKSGYGLALYENCIRYQNLTQTPWIDFYVFRRLMGVEESKYLIFRDFKKRVLDKAVSEVNKYAPIIITPELRRNNRTVIFIRFTIKNSTNCQQVTNGRMYSSDLYQKLINKYSFASGQIILLEGKYKEAYILEKMQLIEKSSNYIQGKITNLAGYLQCALEDNYQTNIIKKQEVKINSNFINSQISNDKHLKTKKDSIEAMRKEYDIYICDCLEKFIIEHGSEKLTSMLNKFMEYCNHINFIMCSETVKREGLKQKWVRLEFALFLRKQLGYDKIFISLDEYHELMVNK
jgi:plasmid replication initiation protein